MDKKILIINAGSSSLKYKVFLGKNHKVICYGLCERIGIDGNFKINCLNGKNFKTYEKKINIKDHTEAIDLILKQMKTHKIYDKITEFSGIGHRVVNCGTAYTDSVLVNDKCLKVIKDHIPVAPLHNPHELKVIKIFMKKLPKVKNVAAFDNSFHSTIPEINYRYAIDKQLADKWEIRKFGYHGISYKYITKQMEKILHKKQVNLIVCHIGNGASISAIKNSKSYDTSMGLTPLEGLVMGTRCGDMDPSVAVFLMRKGMNDEQIDETLNKKSGLQGLVGSSDVRDVCSKLDKGNKDAKLALTMYVKRIAKYIVSYANELEGKVDAVVFTAGVGENQNYIVNETCKNIKLFNAEINDKKLIEKYNDNILISSNNATYPIYRVRTDEELMIANDVQNLTK